MARRSIIWLSNACFLHVVLISLVSLTFTKAFVIKNAACPVVLQDIKFDCSFTLQYTREDEQYDWVQAVVRSTSGSSPFQLLQLNQSVFTSSITADSTDSTRNSVFKLENMLLSTLGASELILDVLLSNSFDSNGTTVTINSGFQSYTIPTWTVPGGLTLLPLAVTMTIAIVTRNVFPALFFGVWSASFVIYQYTVHTSFARTLDNIILIALTTVENQFVILFAMIMGGFVNMINASKGSIGLANGLSKFATTSRSTQFATLVFGLLIFFDDYASALILGATLRTIADKMSVSREKFCFLVDSGAAPIAALVPVTSWTAFETALLQTEADKLVAQGIPLQELGYETSGFLGLLRMLKYAYYSIYLLCFQVFLIATKREFGPMFLAERRALLYGVSDARYAPGDVAGASLSAGDTGETKTKAGDHHETVGIDLNSGPPPKCMNAAIPILFFVFFTVITMVILGAAAVPQHETIGAHNIFANVDSIQVMYYGAVLASFVAAIMYRIQSIPVQVSSKAQGSSPETDGTRVLVRQSSMWTRCCCGKRKRRPLMTFNESIEAFVEGFSHLTSTIMILVLAWSIGIAVDQLGAGRYIATALQGNVPPAALPSLIFFISCAVAFATGTSWGTMALMYPLCGPVAFVLSEGNPELYYASMSAILEGSVFGDHCSFISDTTIMSAMACKCPLNNHVLTQLPYAVFIAVISISCGYVPIGMQALSVTATYFVGFGATILGILILGANPEGSRLDLFNWITSFVKRKCLRRHVEDIPALALMSIPLVPGVAAKRHENEDGSSVSGIGAIHNDDEDDETGPRSLRRPSFEMSRVRKEVDEDERLSHVNNTTSVSANRNPFDDEEEDEGDYAQQSRSYMEESAISAANSSAVVHDVEDPADDDVDPSRVLQNTSQSVVLPYDQSYDERLERLGISANNTSRIANV